MKRRDFLALAATGAAGYGLGTLARGNASASIVNCGTVDLASGYTLLSGSYTVTPGQTFRFDPTVDTVVETPANFIVKGVLEMRPNPGVTHTLRFINVNESAFVGSTMDPVASDVGLWVMNAGRLNVQGTPKTGWNRTGTDPSWATGDEVRVAPIADGVYTTFNTFTPGSPVPQVSGCPSAEVFNLTRSVRIEGTPTGKAHVFVRNTVPTIHTFNHVAMRHMGPQKNGTAVSGRWGLHFHQSGGNNAGTTVTGAVVRDTPAHAFVAHVSHGITFRDCIAYDCVTGAFWWDIADNSDNITYDHCLAAKLTINGVEGAYSMLRGIGNTVRDSVAAGITGSGNTDPNGFGWDTALNNENTFLWTHEDCVAHNIKGIGLYMWTTAGQAHHAVSRFTAYGNLYDGIQHGAYITAARFYDCVLKDPIEYFAASGPSGGLPAGHWRANVSNPSGFGVSLRETGGFDSSGPVQFVDCELTSAPHLAVNVWTGTTVRRDADFIRCTRNGVDLEPSDTTVLSCAPTTVLRFQRHNGTAWQLLPNGTSTPIPGFA